MPHRGRKKARNAKYTIGVDLSHGVDTTVFVGHWDEGVFTIEPRRHPVIIDGEFEVVETDPTRLLDAGGSES